jgi:DNA-binding NarL/FixJ family response regulator
MPISVFLVDDHAVVRDGLRMLLEAQENIRVIGAAADGLSAIREALRLRPEVIVMDIALPGMNGIDAARRILDLAPETRVVVLSMHGSPEHIRRAFRAGAHAYVLKESAGTELVAAVRAAHAGRRYLSSGISGPVPPSDSGPGAVEAEDPLTPLSFREREVFHLVVAGKTSLEIGRTLNLSPKSVDTYRSRLMAKLGIPNLAGLVKFALRHGLAPEE